MGVNSAFTRFFGNRFALRSFFGLAMLSILFIASSFRNHPDHDSRAKEVNLLIRQIGHRLLLQAGDSLSRVLPVTAIREGTFLLRFENEFVFSHDSLMALSQALLPKEQFPMGYTVTVHDCTKGDIVYGFQVNNTSPDILPCRGRRQPPGCYTIEYAFPDFYANVELKQEKKERAEMGQLTEEVKPLKVDPPAANPKSAEPKSATVDNAIDLVAPEPKSFKVEPEEAGATPEELITTAFDYPSLTWVYSGMLVLLGVGLLIGGFGKSLTSVCARPDHARIKGSVPELTGLGRLLFDVKGQRLLLGSEVIGLTDKECKILELLNANFGELMPRDTLLQKVWINEGVITGRSLDMFVSKLRKKLSSDPELRISNVHGKGYKLEICG